MSAFDRHDQALVDAAAMLVLWHRAAPQFDPEAHDDGTLGDRLRLMKLAFLAACSLSEAKIAGLGLSFYRWTWGPLSNEVYDVWERLERAGILHEEEQWIVTEDGASLSDAFYGDVFHAEVNEQVRRAFDEIADRWRGEPWTSELMKHVYALEVVPVGGDSPVAVSDVPMASPIIQPIAPLAGGDVLDVDSAWLETLALAFSPLDTATLESAEDDFRTARFHVA